MNPTTERPAHSWAARRGTGHAEVARLPATVSLRDGEDITAFLARTAAANYRTFIDPTGHLTCPFSSGFGIQ